MENQNYELTKEEILSLSTMLKSFSTTINKAISNGKVDQKTLVSIWDTIQFLPGIMDKLDGQLSKYDEE